MKQIPNLNLPYRWDPLGTKLLHWKPPQPGALIALSHAVWRVIEVSPVPAEKWSDEDRQGHQWRGLVPSYMVIRPASVPDTDPQARDHDVHLRASTRAVWHVYPDAHYPVCAACLEPMPCREQMAELMVEKSGERMDRYSVPGVCPACSEPITSRQKSHHWRENIVVPGGPPVTIHDRGRCKHVAIAYDRDWAAAGPDRRARLSCPGALTETSTGLSCSEGGLCPGGEVVHLSYHRLS